MFQKSIFYWLLSIVFVLGSYFESSAQIRKIPRKEFTAIRPYTKTFKPISTDLRFRRLNAPQVDLRPDISQMGLAVRNQGSRGTCSVHALTFLLEYLYGTQMGNPMDLSEEYLNYASNKASGNTGDGDFFHNINDGYKEYGMLTEKQLSYQSSQVTSVNSTLVNEGKRWTRFEIDFIKAWDPSNGATQAQLNKVIAYLDKKIPVAFGGYWPEGSVPNNTVQGVELMPVLPTSEKRSDSNPNGKMFDGHSVVLVGYCKGSSFPGGGYFIFRNSWGTGYGDNGYGFMPFSYVTTYANDLVAYTTSSIHSIHLSPNATFCSSNAIDVFTTTTTGQPVAGGWSSGLWAGKWRSWWPVLNLNAPVSARLSAVSRATNQIDVFSTDKSGRIYTAAWNKNVDNGQWRGWWPIGTGVTKAGGEVVPVARASTKLDVFVVGTNGGIYTAAWDQNVSNAQWRGWWRIGNLVSTPGAVMAAVARDPNKLDVFAAATNGRVYTAAWDHNVSNGQWRGWWKIQNLAVPSGAPIAAVARSPQHLDIFVVANDGYLYTAAWQSGVANGEWRGWWRVGNQKFKPGTQIAAVARDPNKLDIFAVGTDGGIYTAAWAQNQADGKWRGWWRIKTGVARQDGGISAVARDANKLDVFIIGTDNAVWTAAWDSQVANQEWRGWWRVNP